jgi:hypothetical protein
MADSKSKRFYLGLLIWICGYLLLVALTLAGVVHGNVEGEVYAFLLGLFVIFIFFHPSKK